jgi:hypothetical protein
MKQPAPHATVRLSVNEDEMPPRSTTDIVALETQTTLFRGIDMAQPFIVSIPHKLGKEEATRRLKAGLGSVRSEYGKILQVNEEIWSGDRLAFHVTALKQQVSGTIKVAEDHVTLEVMLPWLLAGLAHGIQATIRARATRMLEKKTTDV